ncbi:hypothetical protein [Nonlabens sp. Hel1_33_55]|uniref:hypothetical protein n=1 Tax=Nonlabens sp. Hel1_33_55 TaxID=1336802 RepID=UPI0012FD66F2|nr:hypothetical protein [Nonlabens sp. Hel1_33_55]
MTTNLTNALLLLLRALQAAKIEPIKHSITISFDQMIDGVYAFAKARLSSIYNLH